MEWGVPVRITSLSKVKHNGLGYPIGSITLLLPLASIMKMSLYFFLPLFPIIPVRTAADTTTIFILHFTKTIQQEG